MKFRSRRRVFKRTSEGKRRRLTNPSNKEDYVPSSDSDSSSGSDENLKEKPQPDEENGGANVLDSDDKGKDVIELSEGQTGSDDSDYVQNISMKKKKNSNKEKECSKDKKKRSHKTGKRKGEAHEEGHEIHGELIIEEADDNNRIPSNKQNRRKRRKRRQRPTLMWEVLEEKNERWIDEHENSDVDLDFQDEGVAETAEPPSDFLVTLLRYQKEWLAWALKQEDSAARGGILADEMGMGKTLQAIALVLAKRVICQAGCSYSSSPSSSMGLPEIKCTLVICPMVAVRQWVYEIERSTPKGSTKVLVYHGSNRWKSLKQFSEYDFVLTTYTIVEAEYRKNVMPPKEKCIWCGKLYYPKKMTIHQRYFCGPHAVKTAGQSKQEKKEPKHRVEISETRTKSAAVKAKTSEFEDKKVKVATKPEKKQIKERKESDIGSYKGSSTSLEQGSPAKKSILHSVKWERIILDEAHYIKDRRSNTTRAVVALESSYKWALSGTPLQNRVGELYSLVRFLRITPFSFYFCRDCDCRVLDYSSTNTCPNCDHKPVRHFCWWNRYVGTPMQSLGNTDRGRRAMILLKHMLLKTIVLRRTKKGRAADLALPPRIVLLRRDAMDDKEEDYYQSLYNESQSQFNTYVEAGTLMNNYAHIFDLLTRLRQAVNHPYLVIYSKTAEKRSGGIADTDEQDCGICHDTAEDPVVTSCAHVFCMACLLDFSDALGQVSCPSCSKPLTVDLMSKLNSGDQSIKTIVKGFKPLSILNRIRLDNFQTSTKIEALREEIRFMIERDGSAKGIVFSQFTSFLDLIHYSLQKSGINCIQLVGSMSMTARDAAITRFTNDPDCRIFLMSLKAGGVALNLTVASHVFLMDPWWNPAVERQAQDRIHRIGQYKPIRTVRFIIEDTIEERILKLQEKKELVFEGTVGGSSEALGKLTEADLRFLFI